MDVVVPVRSPDSTGFNFNLAQSSPIQSSPVQSSPVQSIYVQCAASTGGRLVKKFAVWMAAYRQAGPLEGWDSVEYLHIYILYMHVWYTRTCLGEAVAIPAEKFRSGSEIEASQVGKSKHPKLGSNLGCSDFGRWDSQRVQAMLALHAHLHAQTSPE